VQRAEIVAFEFLGVGAVLLGEKSGGADGDDLHQVGHRGRHAY
jgi:hypothetical protein